MTEIQRKLSLLEEISHLLDHTSSTSTNSIPAIHHSAHVSVLIIVMHFPGQEAVCQTYFPCLAQEHCQPELV